jgi:hypothetical protein
MKKIMMVVVLVFSLSTMYAFSGEESVSNSALTAFKNEFAEAKDAAWTVGNNYYEVAFTVCGQNLFAFYSTEGECMGVTRYISSLQLPLYLQGGLKKSYSNYWIADLFEVANSDNSGYYVTLENADSKIVLRSVDGSRWSVYKKLSKA